MLIITKSYLHSWFSAVGALFPKVSGDGDNILFSISILTQFVFIAIENQDSKM